MEFDWEEIKQAWGDLIDFDPYEPELDSYQ